MPWDVTYEISIEYVCVVQAVKLGKAMKETALSLGVNTTIMISHMDAPLGSKVGNRLEVSQGMRFFSCRDVSVP